VRTIPLQRGFHRERRRAKSNGTTSAAALARRGGDAVEASKDWGPGSKENEPLSGLHLIAARLPQRRTGAGPYLAPTKVEGEAFHRRSDGRAEQKRAGRPHAVDVRLLSCMERQRERSEGRTQRTAPVRRKRQCAGGSGPAAAAMRTARDFPGPCPARRAAGASLGKARHDLVSARVVFDGGGRGSDFSHYFFRAQVQRFPRRAAQACR
jgi:hypothetical protein